MNTLYELIGRLFAEHRRRSDLRSLLAKDDHLLRDIGLTRTEIEASLNLPFSYNARDAAYSASLRSLQLDRAV